MVIVCIKVGSKYPPEYVNRLEAMVRRHTTQPYGFLCLTDNAEGVNPDCIPVLSKSPGWWAKLILFEPHPVLASLNDRLVYLDLDTVIVSNIDFLFSYDGPFCILDDFWHQSYNSSVMSIAPGFGADVWSEFIEHRDRIIQRFHSDQEWITRAVPGADLWQDHAPGKIGSYKADKLQAGPGEFALICFHGNPKPHEVENGWVQEHWR